MKSLAALIALFLVLPGEAQPNRFSSTQGFSFEYPKGWVVVTKEQKRILIDEYKAIFEKLGKVNFDRMAVMVFNPENDEYAENVNVVVSPGRMPASEDSREKLAEMLPKQLRDAGIEATDVFSKITKFGDKQALSVHWTANYPTGVGSIRQWQVAIPGRNQTYIITASASTASFHVYEASFKIISDSFEVDGGSLGVWHSLPKWTQNALVGGVIGALIGLAGSLFKKVTGNSRGTSPDAGGSPTGGSAAAQDELRSQPRSTSDGGPVTFHCWQCKAQVTVKSDDRGKQIGCSSCGTKQSAPW